MAFKRAPISRVFDIIGLIDIIFLLLIFGMIVSGIIIGAGRGEEEEEYPETLTVKVSRIESPEGIDQSHVDILYPVDGHVLTYGKDFPPDDQLLRDIRDDIHESGEAFTLIREKLKFGTFYPKPAPARSCAGCLRPRNWACPPATPQR